MGSVKLEPDKIVINTTFDGNAETLKPEFWTCKTMITYQDSYTVKKLVFFEYGKEVAITDPKPYLIDKPDGTVDLVIEFIPKVVKEFRAQPWQYLPFLFIILPIRWYISLTMAIWAAIFDIEYS